MADIANAYSINNSDSVSKYGNQALALAQKIRFSRGEVSALNALGNMFSTTGRLSEITGIPVQGFANW